MAVERDDDLELTPAQDGEELEEGTEMLPFGDYDRRRRLARAFCVGVAFTALAVGLTVLESEQPLPAPAISFTDLGAPLSSPALLSGTPPPPASPPLSSGQPPELSLMSQVRLAPSLAQTTLPPASAGASVAAASLTNRARMATLVARQSGSAGCRPPETILRSATGLGWPSGSEQLSPPPGGDGASWLSWFEAMLQWRADCRASIRYNGSLFEYAGLRWVQTSFMQPQVHVFDRFLYNDTTHTYTIDRFLADLQSRYGGIDSVLLWPTYPNIGMDDRNQFDMIASLPGGLAKLRQLIDQLHERGVRVLWPLKPWDLGTRRSPDASRQTDSGHTTQMAALLDATGADGINGDTFNWVSEDYFTQSVARGRPIAIEPEGGGNAFGQKAELKGVHDGYVASDRALHDWLNYQTMSWGYWSYPPMPMVDRWKWFDTRHMTHVCDRWRRHRNVNLQAAWINGVGYETWENVWGLWNGISQRDGEAIRRLRTVMTFLGGGADGSSYLASPQFVPFVPAAMRPTEVPASYFPHPDPTLAARGDGFYSLINLGAEAAGDVLAVPFAPPEGSQAMNMDEDMVMVNAPRATATRFFDLFGGTELVPSSIHPVPAEVEGEGEGGGPTDLRVAVLQLRIERGGFGGVLVTSNVSEGLVRLLDTMRRLSVTDLSALDDGWKPLQQRIVPVARTSAQPTTSRHSQPASHSQPVIQPATSAQPPTSAPPEGMVYIPPYPSYHFQSRGLIIEGDQIEDGVDVQFPWEAHPQRQHDAVLSVAGFHIDRYPVTCAQFATFLIEHRYIPRDATRFLLNWARSPSPGLREDLYTMPAGYEKKPATYVSLADARAYCAAYGKRLPRAWEWSLAGGHGVDGRAYPWGSQAGTEGEHFPVEHRGFAMPGPDDVDAHPAGRSPHGVFDLIGNVWQMTDVFEDEHTRAVLTRGGCNYVPQAENGFSSTWYFPQAKSLNEHNKYYIMDDAYERSGTLGFRCVQDAAAEDGSTPLTCWEKPNGGRECV